MSRTNISYATETISHTFFYTQKFGHKRLLLQVANSNRRFLENFCASIKIPANYAPASIHLHFYTCKNLQGIKVSCFKLHQAPAAAAAAAFLLSNSTKQQQQPSTTAETDARVSEHTLGAAAVLDTMQEQN